MERWRLCGKPVGCSVKKSTSRVCVALRFPGPRWMSVGRATTASPHAVSGPLG